MLVKLNWLLFVCYLGSSVVGLSLSQAHEAENSSSEKLLKMVNQQYSLLEAIQPSLLRKNLARVLVVKKDISNIRSNIAQNKEEKKSAITFETMRLIQHLIIKYRFSKNFFGWTDPPGRFSVYTHSTKEELASLKKSYEQMQSVFGFDDSPYTKITANVFRQLKKLIDDLEKLSIDLEVKKQLRSLWPKIGHVIAVAEQGDRPRAFRAATEVIKEIKEKYRDLNKVTSSSTGFNMVMEFIGLTEFYSEFAQIDSETIELPECR